ncbi:MAG TPA: cytochrome ubiquinol oxidase subunit I, partial [Gordonia polyisoprenivorans]|nr:cytochrome ubiquinol oxidase subunit I [Gordonia polyisoprenivorans]
MTAVDQPTTQVAPVRPYPERHQPKGSFIYKLITTTDHKLIGMMYIVACFAFFLIGGLMALLMRAELAHPGMQFLSTEQFNQLFTMHGSVMMFLFAVPMAVGLG